MKINGIKVVPVTLVIAGGVQGFVNPQTIPHEKWTPLHGKTLKGNEVRSPKVAMLEGTDDAIIGSGDGYFSMSADDFEVLCTGGAKLIGYTVEAGKGLRNAA